MTNEQNQTIEVFRWPRARYIGEQAALRGDDPCLAIYNWCRNECKMSDYDSRWAANALATSHQDPLK